MYYLLGYLNRMISASRYTTAQTTTTMTPPQITDIFTGADNVFSMIVPIGTVIAIAMFVYGSYMWMMSAGDPPKIKAAQGILTWTVLGYVFLLLLRLILSLVFSLILKK